MSERSDELLIADIFDSICTINNYTSNITEGEFTNDRKTQDAVSRNFPIIGEAASRLSDVFKQSYNTVNWREIKDFRNKLIHDYFGVNPEIVWNIILNDLPALKTQILEIMQSVKHDKS